MQFCWDLLFIQVEFPVELQQTLDKFQINAESISLLRKHEKEWLAYIYLIEGYAINWRENSRWKYEYVKSSPEEKLLINYLLPLIVASVTTLEQNENIKWSIGSGYKPL